jgi:lipoprotein signal peptidase
MSNGLSVGYSFLASVLRNQLYPKQFCYGMVCAWALSGLIDEVEEDKLVKMIDFAYNCKFA